VDHVRLLAGSPESKAKRKGLLVASKSDLTIGSHEQAGQRVSNEEGAAGAETKANTKVKTVVTATMKRRALKPKKSKVERSR
jgi:hypothetical protein